MRRGRLNKLIAAELGIGEKTVKVHRARMMEKMRVRSVAELVTLGARIGVAIGLVLRVGSSVSKSQKVTNAILNGAVVTDKGKHHFAVAGP